MKSTLTFFITLNKLTGELVLQEGTLISLKIPKPWQKPDNNVKRPALWVCHLPTNSLGIVYISLYPTELVIRKNDPVKADYSEELEEYEQELEEYGENINKEDFLITYRGTLEPNGESEKETFFRCRLKLQKKKEKVAEVPKPSSGIGNFFGVMFIIIACFIGFVWAMKRRG